MPAEERAVLGHRVIVVGSSCAGTSTLGAHLAEVLGAPFVELDALYWRPNWQPTPDAEFAEKILAATEGERWVVAGNYNQHTMTTAWPRADTVIWLDFPLPVVLWRIVRRSWVRSRTRELLWGTNTEKFREQFKLWSNESLITYTVRNHRRRRRFYRDAMASPAWSQIRFVHARTTQDVEQIARSAQPAAGRQPVTSESREASG